MIMSDMRRVLCELREAVLEQVGKDQTDRLRHALADALNAHTAPKDKAAGAAALAVPAAVQCLRLCLAAATTCGEYHESETEQA